MKGKLLVILLTLSVLATMMLGVEARGQTSYKTVDQLIASYDTLEQQYPDLVSHQAVGSTVYGKAINVYLIGNQGGAKVLIDGAIHGHEVVTAEALFYAVEWVVTSTNSKAVAIREGNLLIVNPAINLDNYGVSRYNAHDVDLNRNFPTGFGTWPLWDEYRGEYALSEPETQAVHNTFLTFKPIWYINLHSGYQRISPPYCYIPETPNAPYYEAIYDSYVSQSKAFHVSTVPYMIDVGGGGLVRDEGQTNGAYTFEVELSNSHTPSLSLVKNTYAVRVEALLVAVCSSARIL